MDDSSDLADDIVPEIPQHSPFERKFAPWHKVRKEFVRSEQWNKFVIRYATRFLRRELQVAGTGDWSADSEIDIPETVRIDRPLKCLVIPGDDLLDIRALHRDTESIQCFIRYLGFNLGQGSQQQGTRVHVAHNDVCSSDRISDDSIVLHDPFQRVARQESQAYRYVKDLGPFHVINLDLCDSLFPNRDGDLRSYYEALHGITAYQMKEMATPWMLFITTEVAPNEVNIEELDRFCIPTKWNATKHDDFRNAMAEFIPTITFGVDPNDRLDISRLNERNLIDLFGVALGKALLSFCSSADPKWKVSMLGSHIYSINEAKGVWMLSLAFQFSPLSSAPRDETGLSALRFDQPRPVDESELATRLVKAVAKISDVDRLLADDRDLYTRLFNSSADLLASAGYDREKYIKWVEEGEGAESGAASCE